MKFNSIKFKMTLLYTGILAVILVIYGAILYVSLYFTLYDDLDSELQAKASEIVNTIEKYVNILGDNQDSFMFSVRRAIRLEGRHPEQEKIEEFEKTWLKKVDRFNLREDYINFLNPRGKSIIASKNIPSDIPPIFLKQAKSKGQYFKNIRYKDRTLRLVNMPFYYREDRQYIIQIATSVKPIIGILQNRLFYIAVSIPVVLLCSSFIGRFFAARILNPMRQIAETAEGITYEDLTRRVKGDVVDVEMRYLVNAFNEMISRLENSFKYIAEFSSHVAHELKTPLAIIRGESEVALRKDRPPEEYKRTIQVTLDEVGRMVKTVEDLLLLTRLDYKADVFKFEQFSLNQFFDEIYEKSKILASNKDIAVDISLPIQPLVINGDKVHLRRLFFNLIDNAIKFTPQTGQIYIAVKREEGKAVVSIKDTGIGVNEKDIPMLFNKFFRIHKTDSAAEPGNGLGLTIAQSIANLHDGEIRVKSQIGKGSEFTVILQLS